MKEGTVKKGGQNPPPTTVRPAPPAGQRPLVRVHKSEAGDVIARLLKRGTRQDILDADVVHRLARQVDYLDTELEI